MKPVPEQSVTEALAALEPEAVGPILSELTPEQRLWLQADWSVFAHKAQRTPGGDWTTWLLLGGRGSGKTRAGAEWLAARVGRTERMALIGPSLHDVREVMIDGPSGCGPWTDGSGRAGRPVGDGWCGAMGRWPIRSLPRIRRV